MVYHSLPWSILVNIYIVECHTNGYHFIFPFYHRKYIFLVILWLVNLVIFENVGKPGAQWCIRLRMVNQCCSVRGKYCFCIYFVVVIYCTLLYAFLENFCSTSLELKLSIYSETNALENIYIFIFGWSFLIHMQTSFVSYDSKSQLNKIYIYLTRKSSLECY